MNEIITNFHFIRPWWLLALVAAITLFVLIRTANQRRGQWHNFIPPHLASLLIDGKVDNKSSYSWLVLLVIWILSIVALAGPSWKQLPQPLFKLSSAQIIVMDMSLSMYAIDIKPNRVTRARFKVTDLINKLEEGETGLVAYAGDAFVISPLTEDINNLLNLLPALTPEIMPVLGSAPASGIETALTLFEQTNKVRGDIYLVTDGISLQDQREITTLLTNKDFKLHILAVGTETAAPIKLPNGELLKDSDGNIVLPTLNIGPLTLLAKQFNGRFAQLSLDNSDISYLSETEPSLDHSELSDNKLGDSWHEEGPYLLLLVLPLVALAFRKGVLYSLMLITTGALFFSPVIPQAMAATQPVMTQTIDQSKPSPATTVNTSSFKWWQDLWQTADQQAIKQFNAGNFADAAASFKDQHWQGASYYNNGDYEAALSAFSKNNNLDSIYNQGNALTQLQRYDEAISRYQTVLEQQPDHQAAKTNLAIAQALKKQQSKQPKDQSGDSNEQSSQDQQDSSSDNQSKNDNNSDKQQSASENSSSGDKSPDGQEPSAEQQSPAEQEPSTANESSTDQQSSDSQELSSDKQQPTEQAQKPSHDQTEQTKQIKAPVFDDKDLTKEQQQRLNQLVKKIADDPSLLLRNKMILEARKRRNQQIINKDTVNW